MKNGMRGSIRLVKALADHELWLRSSPFSEGQAWVDLLLLANDSDRTVVLRGQEVSVARGDVLRSMLALEGRWAWSYEKLRAWLGRLQKEGMVRLQFNNRFTRISILNYDLYQSTEPTTEPATEPRTESVTESVTEPRTEPTRNGNGNGKYSADADPKLQNSGSDIGSEIPSDEELHAWASHWPGEPALAIPAGIPIKFVDQWMAKRLESGLVFPRNWQRTLVLSFRAAFLGGYRSALEVDKKTAPPGRWEDLDDLRFRRDRLLDAGEFAAAAKLTDAILER